jgi:signal peptidase
MSIKWFATFLLSLSLLAVVLVLALGGSLRVVVSTSMVPTYWPGDVLVIRPVQGEITPGMVISYQEDDKLITHRVFDVEGDGLITKGDNNLDVDPWRVQGAQVVGRPVLRIPLLGYLIQFIRTPLGWILFVILPAGFFVVQSLIKINAQLKKEMQSGSS